MIAYRDGWQRAGEEEMRMDVSIHKLPPEVEDVERLLEVVRLAHARLLRSPRGRRALERSA